MLWGGKDRWTCSFWPICVQQRDFYYKENYRVDWSGDRCTLGFGCHACWWVSVGRCCAVRQEFLLCVGQMYSHGYLNKHNQWPAGDNLIVVRLLNGCREVGPCEVGPGLEYLQCSRGWGKGGRAGIGSPVIRWSCHALNDDLVLSCAWNFSAPWLVGST